MELSRVAITIAKRGDSFALEETEPEFSFKDTVWVIEDAKAMHFTSLKFAFVI
jgi:hypothetical protein